MPSTLKYVGRLAAFLVAGVLAMTVLSTAPGSAATAKATGTLAATTSASASTNVAARTLARTAPTCWRRHHKCFGSIVVNPVRGKVYFANDRLTKAAARKTAMKKCTSVANYHKYCRSAGWVRNECLGVAARVPSGTSAITQWASALAANKNQALKKAKNKLGGPARNHYAWAYLCTTRKN